MPLLLATNNTHKVTEIAAILGPRHLQLVTPRARGLAFDPVEDGDSYAANALIKARAGCAISALPTLADDSGLEVVVLGNAPGMQSARWRNDLAQPEKNRALIAQVDATGSADRRARFVCSVALVLPTGEEHVFAGECPGAIAAAPRGADGFGYDPVFVVDGYDGLTMAELGDAEKNRISHRARALLALRAHALWQQLEAAAAAGR
ncbi:MAG TPA: non-canonical purine NTP pyrophosphatase [bacterium]|nr:non-canonical purine NTP pyrophosphatase [bacterium]